MRRVIANWWVLTVVVALIALLLLTWGLPIFVEFLRPWWMRLLVGLLIVAVWGTLALLRVRKARRASTEIADELAQPNAANEEGTALAGRMKEALAGLRTASGNKRDYLYTRPWYVIIGPPGSGKTTALLNSGLRFPFADQALKGVGGTRNLDFWFADEAVLIDTAGRYTTQDSDRAVDASGWNSFLALLKKHRPLQPVNGIIVAISVDELIRSDRAQIDAHAAAVMRRLRELRTALEVAAPVYLLLTKADLLAGFTEYFDDLDFEGRRAVLGATLPFAGGKPDMDALAKAFDAMAQSVTDRQAKRLFEEVDSSRRSLLLGFPSQLQSLRARMMRFLEGAFVSGDSGAILRGFYMTSGIQQGAPLDRILSGMADIYDRPPEVRASAAGKAYFLNRLLSEVMFAEAGLVQMDPKARTRQHARMVAMIAGIGLFSLLVLAAWGVSFARNRSFQNGLLIAAADAKSQLKQRGVDTVEVREGDADLRAALPALDALRSLPQGYGARQTGGAPLSMRAGLFQSSLARESEEAYRDGLRRILLPRLLLRIEQYLGTHRGDAMKLYEPLKVYLLLGGQGPGQIDKTAVTSWIRTDWAKEQYPGSDSASERDALEKHLKALLEDPDLAAAWPGRKAPLNGDLVTQARVEVQALSVAERAYAVMRQRATSAGVPLLVSDVITPGDASAFADPKAVLSAQVPYFFTREGYEKSWLVGLATVQQDVERDAWVLGSQAKSLRSDIGNVRPAVAGLYAKDYIDAWEQVVAAMKPADYFSNLVAYGAFTKSPSPLKRVLLELRRNTSFEGGVEGASATALKQRLNRSRMGQFAMATQQGAEKGLDAGGQIASHFTDLHNYVGDGKGQAPVDDFVNAVKEAGRAVTAARSSLGGGGSDSVQAVMAQAMANVAAAAVTGAPPQMKAFLDAATKGGTAAQVSTATGAVTTVYAQSVLPACKGVAQERYPFFGSSAQDAAMVDVMRMFGTSGTIDSFVKQRLTGLLDTNGPLWRWRSDSPLTASLDPASPEEFAKASQVRDMLVAGVSMKVGVDRLGPDTASVELSSGATTQKLSKDTSVPQPVSWAAQGTPQAYVAFTPLTAGAPLVRIEAEGPWALFRLLDKAERQNSGEQAFKATFRSGAQWATLTFMLPTKRNPFSRGDIWSFRCPLAL